MWSTLSHFFGLDDGSGPNYLFWSGLGSDLSEITLLGALLGMYYKHNCHIHRCFRIGRHAVDGTPYVVCKKHHPLIPTKITPEHVEDKIALG